ncbi:MAG: hypothetical protein AB7F88_01200 [Pyrinomonadaceae bacterium]
MNIVPLSREHDRKKFDCGDETVNSFLQKGALQDQENRLSRTCVLIDETKDPKRIVGFHTLLLTVVDQEKIPGDRPKIRRKIPVVLIGQLGVDLEFQGRKNGELLLTDIEVRVAEVARTVGVRCLMLDARSERLAAWYAMRDFERFPDSLRMFKSLQAIRRLVDAN